MRIRNAIFLAIGILFALMGAYIGFVTIPKIYELNHIMEEFEQEKQESDWYYAYNSN